MSSPPSVHAKLVSALFQTDSSWQCTMAMRCNNDGGMTLFPVFYHQLARHGNCLVKLVYIAEDYKLGHKRTKLARKKVSRPCLA